MKRKLLPFKAVVAAVFVALILWRVRERDFAAVLRQTEPLFVVLSFLLVFVMIPSSCLKWKTCLAGRQGQVRFGFLIKVYLIGYFFSNLLPSTVGGDVVRSYYLGRRIGSQSDAAVSVFIERFTGIVLLLALAVVAPLMKPRLYANPCVWIPALGAMSLLVLFAWIWRSEAPGRAARQAGRIPLGLLRRLGASSPARGRWCERVEARYENLCGYMAVFHEKLIAASRCLSSDGRTLRAVIGLTLWFYLMTWVNVFVSLRAFGVRPDFVEISAIVPTIMVVATAPVSLLGNLGFSEGVYVTFLALVGVHSAPALAMGLLLRLKLIVTGVVGLVCYLGQRGAEGTPVREPQTG